MLSEQIKFDLESIIEAGSSYRPYIKRRTYQDGIFATPKERRRNKTASGLYKYQVWNEPRSKRLQRHKVDTQRSDTAVHRALNR
jgi:hypothetical protein